MLIDIGLFLGNQLLQQGKIKVTEKETIDESDVISLKHQLIEDIARLELRVFENGDQQMKSTLDVPVHQSGDWESIELANYTLAFRCSLNA
tara:strand:- start:102 stop:374 length:273 start_codon:yes stop_codon:yes gene_type:complete